MLVREGTAVAWSIGLLIVGGGIAALVVLLTGPFSTDPSAADLSESINTTTNETAVTTDGSNASVNISNENVTDSSAGTNNSSVSTEGPGINETHPILGDLVDIGIAVTTGGVKINPVSYGLIDAYTIRVNGSQQTVTAGANKQFLFLNVSVTNVEEAEIRAPGEITFSDEGGVEGLYPSPGYTQYTPRDVDHLPGTLQQYDAYKWLAVNESERGWVSFAVPESLNTIEMVVAIKTPDGRRGEYTLPTPSGVYRPQADK